MKGKKIDIINNQYFKSFLDSFLRELYIESMFDSKFGFFHLFKQILLMKKIKSVEVTGLYFFILFYFNNFLKFY